MLGRGQHSHRRLLRALGVWLHLHPLRLPGAQTAGTPGRRRAPAQRSAMITAETGLHCFPGIAARWLITWFVQAGLLVLLALLLACVF